VVAKKYKRINDIYAILSEERRRDLLEFLRYKKATTEEVLNYSHTVDRRTTFRDLNEMKDAGLIAREDSAKYKITEFGKRVHYNIKNLEKSI